MEPSIIYHHGTLRAKLQEHHCNDQEKIQVEKNQNRQKCLESIIEFAKSGKFNITGIQVLIDIVMLFEINYYEFKHILNGAHVVLIDDNGLFWERWYNRMNNPKYGYTAQTARKIFTGREQSLAESSHPSLIYSDYLNLIFFYLQPFNYITPFLSVL